MSSTIVLSAYTENVHPETFPMCIRRCIQLVTLFALLLMMYCLNTLYVQYCCVLVCFQCSHISSFFILDIGSTREFI